MLAEALGENADDVGKMRLAVLGSRVQLWFGKLVERNKRAP